VSRGAGPAVARLGKPRLVHARCRTRWHSSHVGPEARPHGQNHPQSGSRPPPAPMEPTIATNRSPCLPAPPGVPVAKRPLTARSEVLACGSPFCYPVPASLEPERTPPPTNRSSAAGPTDINGSSFASRAWVCGRGRENRELSIFAMCPAMSRAPSTRMRPRIAQGKGETPRATTFSQLPKKGGAAPPLHRGAPAFAKKEARKTVPFRPPGRTVLLRALEGAPVLHPGGADLPLRRSSLSARQSLSLLAALEGSHKRPGGARLQGGLGGGGSPTPAGPSTMSNKRG